MDLHLYWPQLLAVAGGLAVLLLDLAFPQGESSPGTGRWRSMVLVAVAAASALLAGFAAMAQASSGHGAGAFLKAFFSGVALLVALMAPGYLARRKVPAAEFYALLLFAAAGMMTVATSTNLIALYLGLELMSQSSYALSGLAKGDPRSTEASLKYFLVGSVASTVTLYGVALLYGSAGSFELAEIAAAAGGGGVGAGQIPAWSGGVGLVLLLVGLGLKVGAVPFHMWVPDTYEGAPTPVTALFSVGPKAAGLAALARVLVFTFPQVRADWSAGLALIATATMTLGNLAALGQENVKRMMAYSSIAQAGYLLAALSVPGAKSVPAFLFYLVTYAAANLGAFAVITWWGTANPAHRISDFQGMGEKAPVAAAILTLCFMSLAGIPPTAGFVGKLRLFSVAVENGRLWLAVFMVLNGVLSVPYYWGVVRAMYFPPAGRFEEAPGPGSPRFSRFEALALALGLSVAVLLVVGLGLYPEPLLETTLAVSSLH